MKRPDVEALLTASCELDTLAQESEHAAKQLGQHEEPDLELAERFALRAVELRAVSAWLDALRLEETERAKQRCTAGRAHRVRDVEPQGDGISVERCRCGAARVRDSRRVGDEVTDWRRSG